MENITKKFKSNEEGDQEDLFNRLVNPIYFSSEKTKELYQQLLNAKPFPHLKLDNLLSDNQFIDDLLDDVAHEDFYLRNSDLYSYYQSDDLNKSTKKNIQIFRSLCASSNFRNFMSEITSIPNLYPEIDLSASIYQNGDYLGCHDDRLEGRKIAFIYYLVPEDWSDSEGGHLSLFPTEEEGTPGWPACHSILPTRNSLCLFPVSVNSYHEVSEVTSTRGRVAVSGWFRGDDTLLPSIPPPSTRLSFSALIANEQAREYSLADVINPTYLNGKNQQNICQEFEENSSVFLPNFLLMDKYYEFSKYTESSDHELHWDHVGPPVLQSFFTPMIIILLLLFILLIIGEDEIKRFEVEKLLRFFKSELFAEFLSKLTNLKLNQQRGEIRKFTKKCYTFCHQYDDLFNVNSLDFLYFFEDSKNRTSNQKSKGDDGKNRDINEEEEEEEEEENDIGGYTSFIDSSDVPKNSGNEDYSKKSDKEKLEKKAEKEEKNNNNNNDDDGDDDDEDGDEDEDEEGGELLRVTPSANCLSLVYTDKHCSRFVKYINHKSKDRHDISLHFTIREDEK